MAGSTGLVTPGILEFYAASWTADTYKAVLLKSTYVFSSAHDFLDDVTAGARLSTVTITGRTNVGGVCGCAPIVFTSVTSGQTATQIWVFRDTGVEATSRLTFYASKYGDGSNIAIPTTGLPGGSLTIPVGSGPNGLFKI